CFEKYLSEHLSQPAHWHELCASVGVTERTLHSYCAEFLGVSPDKYLRLRRLTQARIALRHADPTTASIAAIARSCGFAQLGRFATAYRAAFGEVPSATLQRPTAPSADAVIFSESA